MSDKQFIDCSDISKYFQKIRSSTYELRLGKCPNTEVKHELTCRVERVDFRNKLVYTENYIVKVHYIWVHRRY